MYEWSADVTVRYVGHDTGWSEGRNVYALSKSHAIGKVIASFPKTQRIEIHSIHKTGYRLDQNGYTLVKC